MISVILHCQLQGRPAPEPRSPEACPSHRFTLMHSTSHLVPAAKVPPSSFPGISGADALSQAQLHSRHHNPEAFFSSRRTGQFPSRAAHAVSAAPARTRVAHSLAEKTQACSPLQTYRQPLCACQAAQYRRHFRGRGSGKAPQ